MRARGCLSCVNGDAPDRPLHGLPLRGVVVARRVPAGPPRRTGDGDPIARAEAFAAGQTLVPLAWKKYRDEGGR